MTRRSEPYDPGDKRLKDGVGSALRHAQRKTSKPARLSRRLRVPKGDSWAARVGKSFRDGFTEEIEQRRDGELTAHDFACADQVYFAACGLAIAYSHLGATGWINDKGDDFRPMVESCLKLQNVVTQAFKAVGLDKRQEPADVWVEALRIAESEESNARLATSHTQALSGDSEAEKPAERSTRQSGAPEAKSAEMPSPPVFDPEPISEHEPAAHDPAGDLSNK